MCLLLTMLFFLCLLLHGLAEEIPNHVTVEIVPVAPYPNNALPPGESASEKVLVDIYKRIYTSVYAKAFPGWVFLGWRFERSVIDLNRTIVTSVVDLPEGTDVVDRPEGMRYITNDFYIPGDTTIRAVFAYVGNIPAFDPLNKKEASAEPIAEDTASFAVGIYERDSGGKNGEYGEIFCYPNEFSKDMTVRGGSTILLAAVPNSDHQFSHWSVYKEAKNREMTLFTRSDAALLVLNIDAAHSIDAVFTPAK